MAVVASSRCCCRMHDAPCSAITAGLVTLLAAKAFGADAVAITDLKEANLDLAKQARARGREGVGWRTMLALLCCAVLCCAVLCCAAQPRAAAVEPRRLLLRAALKPSGPLRRMITLPSCHTITRAAGRKRRPADISAGEA